jgi:CheY-like chemotaxis protein
MHEILFVEDTESDARLLERALRLAGVANPIRHAWNGADAYAFFNTKERPTGDQFPLGIIFVDLKLPDKSGFDILTLLQGRKAFADTLRVVVSQMGDMENIKRAYALGADSFIAKPVNQDDLTKLIQSFPEHWHLADVPTTDVPPLTQCRPPEATDTYKNALHLWTKHREIIATLRADIEALQNQLSDDEEAFAIIDTIIEDVRSKNSSTENQPRPRKRPGTNFPS